MFPHPGSRTSKPGLLCAAFVMALVLLLAEAARLFVRAGERAATARRPRSTAPPCAWS